MIQIPDHEPRRGVLPNPDIEHASCPFVVRRLSFVFRRSPRRQGLRPRGPSHRPNRTTHSHSPQLNPDPAGPRALPDYVEARADCSRDHGVAPISLCSRVAEAFPVRIQRIRQRGAGRRICYPPAARRVPARVYPPTTSSQRARCDELRCVFPMLISSYAAVAETACRKQKIPHLVMQLMWYLNSDIMIL